MVTPEINFFGEFPPAARSVDITRGGGEAGIWATPAEVPTAFVYNGRNYAVMMASPTDAGDFAIGFTLTEQICKSIEDIKSVDVHATNLGIECRIKVAPEAEERLDVLDRRRTIEGRSGCGVCGLEAADSLYRRLPKVAQDRKSVSAASVERAYEALKDHQPLNAQTRSVHAAAWADASGNILAAREDVGRHNALDKLLGALALQNFDPSAGFVLMSSRCSYELVQKSAILGVQALAAVSGPTGFALDKAKEANMALIGFENGRAVYLFGDRAP
ncbi:MAG: formate dehydrogenase accessory sulfurtransferase FdhD [Kordiimonadaceae bacterium]|nr:formate dehydrogenase accessory sulfurtransferase FdhD [Kordiimonadaceae bacterium]MBO6568653.1 formate dehydrogenase accessory sulfurtransferase FdhD [Kordiimonadaceae bacterium]MBO6965371.1 formate dehydrogenase accessory sulfurtransferase FdhD [Kordiimonadaceae bacterium]